MNEKDIPTDPYASAPPESRPDDAKRFAQLVKAMLDPIHEEVKQTRASTEQTGQFLQELIRRQKSFQQELETLRHRVEKLEKPDAAE